MKRTKCYCDDCKEIFDWSDARKDFTGGGDRGELHYSCPYCGSDYLEDAYLCELCGGWFPSDNISGSVGNMVCDDCIEKHTTPEEVVDFAETNDHTEIELNGLLAFVYDAGDINELLKQEFLKLPKSEQMNYINDYMDCNKAEFAEYLTM